MLGYCVIESVRFCGSVKKFACGVVGCKEISVDSSIKENRQNNANVCV